MLNKKLGQNFLLSQRALNQIISLSSIQPTDIVLEIGPGKGSLTELLLQKAQKVIAVEKDTSLVSFLKNRFQSQSKLAIIEGDIRDYFQGNKCVLAPDLFQYKVISNPPYYLSSFLLRQFLAIKNKPKLMTLTLQREVAERICVKPGNTSLIGIMVNFYGEPTLGPIIKKNSFHPIPKVDSRILVIKHIKKPPDICEKDFFRIVKIGFSSKRKMLIGNLKNGLKVEKEKLREVFRRLDISEKTRAQELGVEEWKELVKKTMRK